MSFTHTHAVHCSYEYGTLTRLIEQLIRVAVGLSLAYILIHQFRDHPEYASAGATFGASAGAIAGCTAVGIIYAHRRQDILAGIESTERRFEERKREIIKKLLIIAVPITLGSCIMPLMNLIDAKIVAGRLMDMGYSYDDAKALFTCLSSFAGTVINFPQIIIQSIAISMVPAISMAFKEGNKERLHDNISMGLRISTIVSFPCALGLILLAEPVMLLLYPAQEDMAHNSAVSLAILAFGFLFLSVAQILTGVLQGMGRQLVPVRNLAIGAGVKIVLTYYLTGMGSLNVAGAAIGTCAAYMVASVLDLWAVRKYTDVRVSLRLVIARPLMAVLAMGIVTVASYYALKIVISFKVALLISIGSSAVAYVMLIVKLGAIQKREIENLPKGTLLVRIMRIV